MPVPPSFRACSFHSFLNLHTDTQRQTTQMFSSPRDGDREKHQQLAALVAWQPPLSGLENVNDGFHQLFLFFCPQELHNEPKRWGFQKHPQENRDVLSVQFTNRETEAHVSVPL